MSQPPQLASLAAYAPAGAEWISEVKFDGYRLLAAVDHGNVRLLTRSGLDWSDRLPAVCARIADLGLRSAMLDGELVVLLENGVSSFPALQAALKAGRDDACTFYAFDLLHLDGWDLRPCTLIDRKALLALMLLRQEGMVRYSDHHQGQAAKLHQNACRMGLEGSVCKRRDRPYQPGRGGDWLKLKCRGREEFVVIGWSRPSGSRVGIGGLQLGYYGPDGMLYYAGGVGSGFDDKELVRLRVRLGVLHIPAPDGLMVAGDPLERGLVWVRPEMVAEVTYTGWAGAGRLRHAVYLGLREDKPAREVVRDVADPEAPRWAFSERPGAAGGRKGWHGAVPPRKGTKS